MSKKGYRDQIDKNRQSLSVEEYTAAPRLTRTEKRRRKRKINLIRVLLVIFIFIPLLIFVYVWKFYDPGKDEAKDVNGSAVTFEKKDEPASTGSALKDDNEQDSESPKSDDQGSNSFSTDDKEEEDAAVSNDSNSSTSEESATGNATNGEQKVHIVKQNESLYKIAQQYYDDPNEGVEKIKEANGLTSNIIQVNQQLIIP